MVIGVNSKTIMVLFLINLHTNIPKQSNFLIITLLVVIPCHGGVVNGVMWLWANHIQANILQFTECGAFTTKELNFT